MNGRTIATGSSVFAKHSIRPDFPTLRSWRPTRAGIFAVSLFDSFLSLFISSSSSSVYLCVCSLLKISFFPNRTHTYTRIFAFFLPFSIINTHTHIINKHTHTHTHTHTHSRYGNKFYAAQRGRHCRRPLSGACACNLPYIGQKIVDFW